MSEMLGQHNTHRIVTTLWQVNTAVWEQSITIDESESMTLWRRYHDSTALHGGKFCLGGSQSTFLQSSPLGDNDIHHYDIGRAIGIYPLVINQATLTSQVLPVMQKVAENLAYFHSTAQLSPFQNGAPLHLLRLEKYLANRTICLLLGLDSAHLHRTIKALTNRQRLVPSQGNYSIGNIYVRGATADSADMRLSIPTGPETTRAAPELDLGWILGDLIEIIALTPGKFTSEEREQPWAHPLIQRIFDGYVAVTTPLDMGLLADAVSLRITLHMCDFITTMGDDPLPLEQARAGIDIANKVKTHGLHPTCAHG